MRLARELLREQRTSPGFDTFTAFGTGKVVECETRNSGVERVVCFAVRMVLLKERFRA
jgi:hypothetical protein